MNPELPLSSGAVSLSFDDALDEHLDQAIPTLTEHGLRGTFYVHLAATSLGRRAGDWRAAARLGHELGNHTIFHPADRRKAWVREGNAIDGYTLDRMHQELAVANRLLQALDGAEQRTFAYPCSNSILGRRGIVKALLFKFGCERTRLPGFVDRWRLDVGSTEVSYVPLVRELFVAGRGSGLCKHSVVPSVNSFDRFNLPSVSVDRWSWRELVDFTERGLADRTWVILQFHGVGGGHHLNCDFPVFRDYVSWLSDSYPERISTIRDVAIRLWSKSEESVCPDVASQAACWP